MISVTEVEDNAPKACPAADWVAIELNSRAVVTSGSLFELVGGDVVETFKVQCKLTQTIKDLKIMIQDQLGFSVEDQILMKGDSWLPKKARKLDDKKSLQDNKVTKSQSLSFDLKKSSNSIASKFSLCITLQSSTLGEREFTPSIFVLSVHATQSVLVLKNMIAHAMGISQHQQYLVVNNREMLDANTLHYYGIGKRATLNRENPLQVCLFATNESWAKPGSTTGGSPDMTSTDVTSTVAAKSLKTDPAVLPPMTEEEKQALAKKIEK